MKITEKNLLENEIEKEDQFFNLRRSVLDNKDIYWGYYKATTKVETGGGVRVTNKRDADFIIWSSGIREHKLLLEDKVRITEKI